MKEKETIYLFRLWKESRFLFVLVSIFIAINLCFNLIIKSEITPFFQWSLYATPIAKQSHYTFLEVKYNNKLLTFPHTWQEPGKLLFVNTLNAFISLKVDKSYDYVQHHYESNWLPAHPLFKKTFPNFKPYNDAAELAKFPIWYKLRLEQLTGESIYSINVFKTTVIFLPSGKIKKQSSTLIYSLL